MGDMAHDAHRILEVELVRHDVRWLRPIDDNARAGKVVPASRDINDTGTVSGGDHEVFIDRHVGDRFIETVELFQCGILFFVVRCRHMGEGAMCMDVRIGFELFEERRYILWMSSDAVHARIDRQHDFDRFLRNSRDGFQGVKIDGIIDRHDEVFIHTDRHILRQRQSQYIDRAGESGVAQLRSFFHTGNSRSDIAFFEGDAQRFLRTMSIGIRLHDSEHIHFLRQMRADDLEIVTKRIQIDFHVRNRHLYSSHSFLPSAEMKSTAPKASGRCLIL